MRFIRSKHWFWLLIPVALVVAAVSYRSAVRRKVALALREIRASGYPATLHELDNSYPSVPVNENAALLFVQNFQGIRPPANDTNLPVVGNANLPPLGTPLSEAMRAAIRKYLAINRSSLEVIDQAMKLPRSRYPIDLNLGSSLTLPNLATTKGAAQMLRLEGILEAAEGNSSAAAHAIQNQIALANTLRDEPILISALVRIAIFSLATKTLESALYQVDFDARDLDQIAGRLREADLDLPAAFKRSMGGERCLALGWFQTPGADALFNPAQEIALSPVLRVRRWVGLWDADELYYLNFFKRFLQTADQPFPEALDSSARLFSDFEKVRYRYFASGLLLPSLEKTQAKFTQLSANLRTAQAGIALYKAATSGRPFPPDLRSLAATNSLNLEDPFAGKPLLTLRTNHSLMIYSVGADRMDNHAQRSGTNYDIFFEVRTEPLSNHHGGTENTERR